MTSRPAVPTMTSRAVEPRDGGDLAGADRRCRDSDSALGVDEAETGREVETLWSHVIRVSRLRPRPGGAIVLRRRAAIAATRRCLSS